MLSLAEPLPAASVIGMAGAGDPAYRAGTAATVYGWGDTTGSGSYAKQPARGARVRVQPDALCEKAYPRGSDSTYRAERMLCAGEVVSGRDACQGTAGGRWSPRGGS